MFMTTKAYSWKNWVVWLRTKSDWERLLCLRMHAGH